MTKENKTENEKWYYQRGYKDATEEFKKDLVEKANYLDKLPKPEVKYCNCKSGENHISPCQNKSKPEVKEGICPKCFKKYEIICLDCRENYCIHNPQPINPLKQSQIERLEQLKLDDLCRKVEEHTKVLNELLKK